MQTIALILHFKTPELTFQCIHSLFQSGIKDVVIIDNSNDQQKSYSIVKEKIENLIEYGLTTHYIDNNSNLGFANGVNIGISFIKTLGYANIFLLNSDATLNKHALKLMLDDIEHGYDIIHPLEKNNSGEFGSYFYYHKYFALYLRNNYWGSIKFYSGVGMLITSKNLDQVRYDDDFFFYGEDVELSYRLQKQGLKIKNNEDCYIIHHKNSSSKNGSFFYEYNINYAHWLLAKKLSEHLVEYIVCISFRLFFLTMRALYRSIKNKDITPIHGYLAASLDFSRKYHRFLKRPKQ
jgi:N-acetylglucosaminyl-diphospho-decaprenol L-rhamnosyltransferase